MLIKILKNTPNAFIIRYNIIVTNGKLVTINCLSPYL